MVSRIVGSLLAISILYMTMFLAGLTGGLSVLNFWNLESLMVVFLISYFCTVASSGTFKLDLHSLKIMHKLVMPVSWIGFLIGFIIMLLSFSNNFSFLIKSDLFIPQFFQSISIAIITVFYGLIIKVVLTILIDSKSNN